jgi:hypothetical protein
MSSSTSTTLRPVALSRLEAETPKGFPSTVPVLAVSNQGQKSDWPVSQFLSVPEVELYCEPTNRDKNPKESRQRKAYNKGFVSKILCIT